MTIEVIITYVLGVILGSVLTNILHYAKSGRGTLQIFHGEEKDSYNFSVDKLDDLNKKRRFILDVKHYPR